MFLTRLSRLNPNPLLLILTRHLSNSSKLHDRYSFKPPPSLSPNTQGQNPNHNNPKKQQKPQYRPPSSLDRTGQKPIHSDLPFDFRYSYTESSPTVRPIGLREPKYSPFGPGRIDREWIGVCAPAVDPKVRSVEGAEEDPKLEEKRKRRRQKVQGEPLTPAERKILVDKCQRPKTKRQINLGRDGLTHNMLNDIQNHWKHDEAVRIKCLGVPTVDMKNVCTQLEDKTFGKIIHRHGGVLVLYRGRNYKPKKRPVIPLMLWRPHEPVYPRLIKTTIDGLSIEETKEMRKRGLVVPPLTKLAKNGYYGSLVSMVRDAFICCELVRIDCQGLEKSDYKKIGCKLRDLVPCILVTFEKEQIVVWRGKDYKPLEDGYFLPDRELFDNPEGDLVSANMGESTDAHKLHSSKDDQVFLSSFKDVGRDGHARNWPVDGYNNSPIHKDNSRFMSGLHPEPGFFSNGSTASSGKYSRGNPTSQSSCMDEPAGIWSQRMHSDHNSPLVSLSLNSNSSNLLTNGSFPASRISSWTGFSLPSSYSCLDASPHGTQKLLDRNRDYHYSTRSSPLLKSSSPFSSSELKKLPSTSVSLRSDKLKTKISSNDWEPSVPFQPSFILPPAFLSSSGSQYDPLRDSIDLPKLANISFEASFYSEEAAIGNKLHHQILGESVSGTMRPVCDGDTNSMSSHNTCHEKVLDNSCYTREHNSPVTEAETVGASVVCQNGTMAIEENLSGPSHLKGSTKPHKTSSYGDSRPQSDSSRHKKDITVDRFRENNEVDGEHVTDGDVQQESKALRHFRAALVELVKELLKPKWREGCLSKDAHNKIVKKAVEKVLSAFQPQQIPPTVETVLQYLSSCRPKISKLVEGYVEKYGKS